MSWYDRCRDMGWNWATVSVTQAPISQRPLSVRIDSFGPKASADSMRVQTWPRIEIYVKMVPLSVSTWGQVFKIWHELTKAKTSHTKLPPRIPLEILIANRDEPKIGPMTCANAPQVCIRGNHIGTRVSDCEINIDLHTCNMPFSVPRAEGLGDRSFMSIAKHAENKWQKQLVRDYLQADGSCDAELRLTITHGNGTSQNHHDRHVDDRHCRCICFD